MDVSISSPFNVEVQLKVEHQRGELPSRSTSHFAKSDNEYEYEYENMNMRKLLNMNADLKVS